MSTPAEKSATSEQRFDIAPDFILTTSGTDEAEPLVRLTAAGEALTVQARSLLESYYDTASWDLIRCGLTLRRDLSIGRTHWRLRLPARIEGIVDGRTSELTWTDGPDANEPPTELIRMLEPFSHGLPLIAVSDLKLERTTYLLGPVDVPARLQFDDDEVWADPGAAPIAMTRWRELRVSAGPTGSSVDVAAAAGLLIEAGAVGPATEPSLVKAAFGPVERIEPDRAATVLIRYLRSQIDLFTAAHFAVAAQPFESGRPAEPREAIHKARVATRRIRATLRTFAPLFEPVRAAQLDTELRWIAAELGMIRDREVLRVRLARAVDDLPAYLVVGPVADRIDQVLADELHRYSADLATTMRAARYHGLVDELSQWRAKPPFTAAAHAPERSLNAFVGTAEKRLAKRMRHATSRRAPDRDLHAARKAGKRARYAAEAAEPALGRRADRLAGWGETVQTLLGEHQDSVVATELLRRLADDAAADGESAFTYGILVAEQRRTAADSADAARDAADRRAAKASKRRLTRARRIATKRDKP